MAAHGFSPAQISKFREVFTLFDNGSGLVIKSDAVALFESVAPFANLADDAIEPFLELFDSFSRGNGIALRDLVNILSNLQAMMPTSVSNANGHSAEPLSNGKGKSVSYNRDTLDNIPDATPTSARPKKKTMMQGISSGLSKFFGTDEEEMQKWQKTVHTRVQEDSGIVRSGTQINFKGITGSLRRQNSGGGSGSSSTLRHQQTVELGGESSTAHAGKSLASRTLQRLSSRISGVRKTDSTSSLEADVPLSATLARRTTSRVGFHELGNAQEKNEIDAVIELAPARKQVRNVDNNASGSSSSSSSNNNNNNNNSSTENRLYDNSDDIIVLGAPKKNANKNAISSNANVGATALASDSDAEFLRLQEQEMRFYEEARKKNAGRGAAGRQETIAMQNVGNGSSGSSSAGGRPNANRRSSLSNLQGSSEMLSSPDDPAPMLPPRANKRPQTVFGATQVTDPDGVVVLRPANTNGRNAIPRTVGPSATNQMLSPAAALAVRNPNMSGTQSVRGQRISSARPLSIDMFAGNNGNASGPPSLAVPGASVSAGHSRNNSSQGAVILGVPGASSNHHNRNISSASAGQHSNGSGVSNRNNNNNNNNNNRPAGMSEFAASAMATADIDYTMEDWFSSDAVPSEAPPAYSEREIRSAAASHTAAAAPVAQRIRDNRARRLNRGQKSWARLDTLVKTQLKSMAVYKPYFIWSLTAIQILIFIIEISLGGVTTISFRNEVVTETFTDLFGAISQQSRNTTPNFWIGPNLHFLVNFGAKFTPCMRRDEALFYQIGLQEVAEIGSYGCCRVDSSQRCGQTPSDSCTDTGLTFFPNGRCEVVSPNCDIVVRPCCLDVLGRCAILTKEACDFYDGYWKSEAEKCSEFGNCLPTVCGIGGMSNPQKPDQWFRFIIPLFIHVGVLHLLFCMLFQLSIGVQIERNAGPVRTFFIYMISGIGGNIFSAIFVPYQPQAGCSPALFGLLGVMVVELFQSWQLLRSPFAELLKLLAVLVVAFFIGLLPWVDNFAHIGGFFFGIFAAIVFLPYIVFGKWDRRRKIILLIVCVPVIIFSYLILIVIFYQITNYNLCSWCRYLDCVDFTPEFCTNLNLF